MIQQIKDIFDQNEVQGVSYNGELINELVVDDELLFEHQGPNDRDVILRVEKITDSTGGGKYKNQTFIALDIYPKAGGTVYVTYDGLTKIVQDDGKNGASPNSQMVYFGIYNDVSDEQETADSGILTISGDYSAFGCTEYSHRQNVSGEKGDETRPCDCILEILDWGSVTKIPTMAFQECKKIEHYEIPDTVKLIDESAFWNNTGIKSITINGEDVAIKGKAFSGSSLESIEFREGVSNIQDNAFQSCASLKDVYFHSTCPKKMSSGAFYQITQSINFHITDLDSWLAMDIQLLPSLSLSSERFPLEKGGRLLLNDTIVTSITLSKDKLKGAAMAGYESLYSIAFDDNNPINAIPAGAFSRCLNLTEITLPSYVTEVGVSAFQGSGITKAKIEGVVILKQAAFASTPLTELEILGGIILDRESVSITYSYAYGTFSGCSFTSLDFLDKIVDGYIPRIAFSGCSNLRSVVIPNSITYINEGAFWEHSSSKKTIPTLEEFYISDLDAFLQIEGGFYSTLENQNLFLNGELITSLIVPEGCNKINTFMYYYPKLESINIPSSLTDQLNIAQLHNLTGLTSFSVSNENPMYASFGDCLYTRNFDTLLCVPSMKDASTVSVHSSTRHIGNYAFYKQPGIISMDSIRNIETIGNYAFYGCESIDIIEDMPNLISIGAYAFSNCSNLSEVHLSAIKAIGQYAFANCNIILVDLPEIEQIDQYAFDGNTISTLYLSDTLKTVGKRAFGQPASDVTVYIDSVEAWFGIQFAEDTSNPFYNSSEAASLIIDGSVVTDLIIPDTVTEILSFAFTGMKFNSITLPENIKNISSKSFTSNPFSSTRSDFYVGTPSNPHYLYAILDSNTSKVTINEGTKIVVVIDVSSTASIIVPPSVESFLNSSSSNTAKIYISNIENWVKSNRPTSSMWNILYGHNRLYLNDVLLTSLDLSDTQLEEIPKYAFNNAGVYDIIKLPSTLKKIGLQAFTPGSQNEPRTIFVIDAVDPPALEVDKQYGTGPFGSGLSVKNVIFIVPTGCGKKYTEDIHWSQYAKRFIEKGEIHTW